MRQSEMKLTVLSIICMGILGVCAQKAPAESYQVEIVAADMCCKGCVQKVAGQLYAAPGVTTVDANLENRTVVVTVSGNKRPSLEQLWQAVAAGKGGPTELRANDATFKLTPPEALDKSLRLPATTNYVIIENLNHEGRAQRIANQLYTVRGVEKVSVDTQQNALIVTSKQPVSPWSMLGAVTAAQERPLAIIGAHGKLSIDWTQRAGSSSNQQAQQFKNGGIQR
jgi:copper chaperone CopZ